MLVMYTEKKGHFEFGMMLESNGEFQLEAVRCVALPISVEEIKKTH